MALPGWKVDMVWLNGNGAGFHEGVEVGLVNLEAPRRGHFQAATALVALFHMQVHGTGNLLVFHNSLEGAGCGNLRYGSSRVGAFFREPYWSKCMASCIWLRVSPVMQPSARFLMAAPKPLVGCP